VVAAIVGHGPELTRVYIGACEQTLVRGIDGEQGSELLLLAVPTPAPVGADINTVRKRAFGGFVDLTRTVA
jgi:hypothetical protein